MERLRGPIPTIIVNLEDKMRKAIIRYRIIQMLLIGIIFLLPFEARSQSQQIFQQRRQKLIDQISDGIVIMKNSEDNKDFYYLTGFPEEDAALILIPGSKHPFVMFVTPRNPSWEIWMGERVGVAGAKDIFGAGKAFAIDEFEKKLGNYVMCKQTIYFSFDDDELNDELMKHLHRPGSSEPRSLQDVRSLIHEMRLIKDKKEIKLLKKAIDITCEAQIEVMKAAEPGMFEYELQAVIEYIYRKNGSPRPGFSSIVGSGPNSIVLHYNENNRKASDGDVVCMDIGAEYGGYTADVTRTIPINGKFTREQREIYEAVLRAQEKTIDMVKPGIGLSELQNHTRDFINQELLRLGLITDIESGWQTRLWMPHGTGHWLGLDVHDVGDYRWDEAKGRILEPGMVFTVEPGIYVTERVFDHLSDLVGGQATKEELDDFIQIVKPVASRYDNIGVRIEDDILVTADWHENLSKKAPKKIKDIEKLMNETSHFTQ